MTYFCSDSVTLPTIIELDRQTVDEMALRPGARQSAVMALGLLYECSQGKSQGLLDANDANAANDAIGIEWY